MVRAIILVFCRRYSPVLIQILAILELSYTAFLYDNLEKQSYIAQSKPSGE